jgi:hypothetical protein
MGEGRAAALTCGAPLARLGDRMRDGLESYQRDNYDPRHYGLSLCPVVEMCLNVIHPHLFQTDLGQGEARSHRPSVMRKADVERFANLHGVIGAERVKLHQAVHPQGEVQIA